MNQRFSQTPDYSTMGPAMQKARVARHLVLFVAIGLLPFVATFLAQWLLPQLPVQMRPEALQQLLWLSVGVMVSQLRQRATQLAGVLLVVLSALGQAHAMAAFVHYGVHFRTDLQSANLVFLGMTVLHLSGMLIYERAFGIDSRGAPPPTVEREQPWSLFVMLLLAFPILWAVDLVVSVGHIPLFSGGAFVNEIYRLDYGRLYGYGLVMALAILFARERLRQATSRRLQIALVCLLAIYCFISVLDGKRVFLMIFLLGLLVSELRWRDWSQIRARFGGIAVGLIVIYVGIEVVRQGGQTSHRDHVTFALMATGVEYRDFAFVLQNIGVRSLEGYDLLKSAIGGFANWFILALFGVSKGEYVHAGSAYQIAIAMRSNFGIRIGLLPELYLGYGLLGGVAGMFLGAAYAWLVSMLPRMRTEVGAALLCLVLAVFLLGYVGQASATTGYLSILLYTWLLWRLLTALGNRFRYPGGMRSRLRKAVVAVDARR